MTTRLSYSPEDLAAILDRHDRWLRGATDGQRANLAGANLGYANLRDAELRNANLRDANLGYANLSGANLWGANLQGANLGYAELRNANLRNANIRNANLQGASMPAGYSWETYLAAVVPALLEAGGKPVTEVIATLRAHGGWAACHAWVNCPIHTAFGASSLNEVPPLYRWEAAQFIQLFDAGLIPEPTLPAEAVA